MRQRTAEFFIAMLVLGSTQAHGRTWHVRPDGTGDTRTIQVAIDTASAGDVVLLAPGTYSWTSQTASGHSMIRMKPGLTLTSESGAESTILDGENQGRLILCQQAGNEVRIEGLTVQHGMGIPTRVPPYVFESGGGIYADDGSDPVISNCIIRDNRVKLTGAGIFCFNARVTGCSILGNQGILDSYGIGIHAQARLTISRCTIRGNHSIGDALAQGGGVMAAEADMSDCWIENNSADGITGGCGGGAVIGRGTISRCVFVRNRASGSPNFFGGSYGGALEAGSCTVSDCIFVGNGAHGGEIPGAGGAIATTSSRSRLIVTRCTLIGNRATGGGTSVARPIGGIAAVDGDVTNTIIAWSEGLAVNSTMTTSCCDFFGNTLGDSLRGIDQGGNFSATPQFCAVDPASSLNFFLQSDSPCAPGNHPDGVACGLIGAAGVGCESVAVRPVTWTEVRLLYR